VVADFGARVRARRDELKMSQEKLADKVGVHRSAIGHIENGTRELGIGKVAKLAQVLGVDPERPVRSTTRTRGVTEPLSPSGRCSR
jgi:transcriptional regulator with XRE-family HTH domain